jgi:hypothetical protein
MLVPPASAKTLPTAISSILDGSTPVLSTFEWMGSEVVGLERGAWRWNKGGQRGTHRLP